jgi:ribonuclease P protein component
VVESTESRVGLVVPKHGQSAVHRNRLKRQLREQIRLRLLPALREAGPIPPMNVVLRAQPAAYGVAAPALREEFDTITASVIRFATERV